MVNNNVMWGRGKILIQSIIYGRLAFLCFAVHTHAFCILPAHTHTLPLLPLRHTFCTHLVRFAFSSIFTFLAACLHYLFAHHTHFVPLFTHTFCCLIFGCTHTHLHSTLYLTLRSASRLRAAPRFVSRTALCTCLVNASRAFKLHFGSFFFVTICLAGGPPTNVCAFRQQLPLCSVTLPLQQLRALRLVWLTCVRVRAGLNFAVLPLLLLCLPRDAHLPV